jgi:hypothetical protein
MPKSSKISEICHFGLSKSTRRNVAQIRARWSTEEARSRRRLAAILQRHLSFIATIENC